MTRDDIGTDTNLTRRQALSALAGATAGLLVPFPARADARRDRLGPLLPLRRLGATGRQVPLLGLGGWHVGDLPRREVPALIEAALAGGVRFFDTAESYQDGESERRYGEFLVPRYRDDVFLMSKTTAPDAETARRHLEGSLRRLRTEQLDLWQVHAIRDADDVDDRLTNGVVEELHRQRDAGRVRHIGFTGHRTPAAHRRMLERDDTLETCQMPVNLLDPSYESFVTGVLPQLVERDVGVLAMKTLANGRFFREQAAGGRVIPDRSSLHDALAFGWSLPVAVLIYGPDNIAQLRQTLDIARGVTGLDGAARQALVERAADLAGPALEYYKA
jgi:aryl-alcohol dehydrogenase-like predicted oxidoreductase